jgi:4-amino-4-deoxy-L-arabinose transferase-like glycosyltransferase
LGVYTQVSAFVILTLNSVFSALTCVAMGALAERTVGRRAGLLAGWTWALVPLFIRWPTTWVWDTSLSALLVSMAFLFALKLAEHPSRGRWAAFGVFWGITALTNPSLLTILPFTLAWPGLQLARRERPWGRGVAITLVAALIVVMPWLVRNRVVFGQVVFIRDNFPFEFHLGNYHGSNGMGWVGRHPTFNTSLYDRYRQMGEMAFIAESRRVSLRFLREYPGEFIALSAKRAWWFWDGTALEYLGGDEHWKGWMFWPLSLLTLLGLVLAVGHGIRGAWMFGLALLFYPMAYYITYPQLRYRHAVEPEMLLLSACFVIETVRHFRRRFTRAEQD